MVADSDKLISSYLGKQAAFTQVNRLHLAGEYLNKQSRNIGYTFLGKWGAIAWKIPIQTGQVKGLRLPR